MSERLCTLEPALIESMLARTGYPARIFLAYSGGVDSHVLLHLCLRVPVVRDKLTAVHVHHGLQEAAEAWPAHCRKTVEPFGIGFRVIHVDARPAARQSPEEAARSARYQALSELLEVGDVLLVAQHREDQLETLLLQLLRGAGLPGLSAMPAMTALGKGMLLRPLLDVSKQAIDDYAHLHRLNWVEDPSNLNNDYDRNYLRNRVLPLLRQRWPALDKTVSRSARHCAEAQTFIGQAAEGLLETVWEPDGRSLAIFELQKLDRYRQQLVIRQWFVEQGLKRPSRAFVDRVLNEMLVSPGNGDAVLSNQQHMIRRYRNRLFCLPASGFESETVDMTWFQGDEKVLLPGGGYLRRVRGAAGIDARLWQTSNIDVRYRTGGEKIALPGRQGRHSLKKLYQEAGIPPWERPSIPLVFLDGRLAAVADLWISADFFVENQESCFRLHWCRQKNKNGKGND